MDDVSETHLFTSHDGTQLAYLDEGNGPAVVLLHGLTANGHANWMETGVVGALLGAGYRAIALDARGHGQSDAPQDDAAYRPEVIAGDVTTLVEMLGIEPVSMIGYSYGSVTTAHLAAAGELKLRSIALCGVGMSSLTPIAAGPEIDALLAALRVDDPAATGDEGVVAMHARMAGWNARPFAVAAVYSSLRELEPIDLAAITVPVLVVNSPIEPADVAPEIPGARSVIVGGDHLSAPFDRAFTEAIIAFLQETDPV